jgi:HK97 family phage portal protein
VFVSQGSLVVTKTPLSLTSPSYFPWMPPMSGGWPSAYSAIYTRQLWVYVLVTKRARATARLPLPVYQRNEEDRPRRDDHPMAKLLAQPNPGMSGFDLMLWTSSTFDIFGEAFWLKKRNPGNGSVVGLFPLHPSSMAQAKDRTWTFDNGTTVIEGITPGDLVTFRSYNPNSLTRGLSPLEPLRATLENEWHARSATSSFWQRGARPGMALVHKGQLSEPAQTRLKAQMDSVAAGSDKTGVTIVLEEGMEPKPMTLTAEEAQYIETRKLNREEACAAYDTPPPVVHILDRATFSNITEQMRSMYRDTMAPHLKGFEASIEMDLRRAEWPADDVYAEFLMDEVLRGDFETRQDALAKAAHMTIAEKRKVENLPFLDGTDRIFLNAGILPMPLPQSGDAPAAPPFATVGLPALIEAGVLSEQDARRLLGIDGAAPGPATPPDVIPLTVVRSVMSRLGRQKGLRDVDPIALVEGLNGSTSAVLRAFDREMADGGTVPALRERIRAMAEES